MADRLYTMPEAFVLSMNLARRHLNESQRATEPRKQPRRPDHNPAGGERPDRGCISHITVIADSQVAAA